MHCGVRILPSVFAKGSEAGGLTPEGPRNSNCSSRPTNPGPAAPGDGIPGHEAWSGPQDTSRLSKRQ